MFSQILCRKGKGGDYSLSDLTNMNQTPFYFVLEDDKTYDC